MRIARAAGGAGKRGFRTRRAARSLVGSRVRPSRPKTRSLAHMVPALALRAEKLILLADQAVGVSAALPYRSTTMVLEPLPPLPPHHHGGAVGWCCRHGDRLVGEQDELLGVQVLSQPPCCCNARSSVSIHRYAARCNHHATLSRIQRASELGT